MSTGLTACCVHCGQTIAEVTEVRAIAKPEIRRLRDHLLGCPKALAACAPALPVFRRASEVLKHFRVDGAAH
jgi:hypothetical protein